ncbi:hypothetical protein PBRA_002906 [Plasmodiophora brassicae]|uniref:Non-specific serine/threonine protein kinase n=1 Tax=Plasmodiophora brassicae TaxID=37360 RepID=A0A0G4J6C2_PLABS|nr:hypothetical protein PBRA_002906 [Plasmodiophora brassicae]
MSVNKIGPYRLGDRRLAAGGPFFTIQRSLYRLGKTLGVGSFSKVKMAVHEPTNKKVAIKILNRKKLNTMDMGQKVRREINILRLFMHAHIIRLYEVIDTPTDIFVVMEYVSGGELFDYIVSRGRLGEAEARRFFQQIISGVEYCHSHMVVHRDLKPENLLLDETNNVKIADFGLSNMMRDGFFLKTSCGSPNYAAPEVISGSLYAGPEVDVWSCGVILFALLCGSLPFDDENIPNLFRKIREGAFVLPSYLSDGARDLIPKMLVVDPVKRITIDGIRKHPWFMANLPRYLKVSPMQEIARSKQIDEDALAAVIEMGWPRESILQALAMGPDLLTNSHVPHNEELRPMSVAYHLMLDHKRKIELDDEIENAIPSPASAFLRDRVKFQQPSPVSVMSQVSSIPPTPVSQTGSPMARIQFDRHRRIWLLGIQTKLEPAKIMAEIFRCLRAMNMQWKMLAPYKLKTMMMPSSESTPLKDVKLGVQLYKNWSSGYVIDLQKISGQAFPFMDMCTLFAAHWNIV